MWKFFFRPTPHSFRQVVHHAGKLVADWQIRLINAKTSSIFTKVGFKSWTEVGPVQKSFSWHDANIKKRKQNKQTKQKTNQKQKQTQNKQTTTNNKTKRAGWSAGQFRNVGNLKKGDSIVSSLVSS